MDIKSVNMKGYTISDERINYIVDPPDHASDNGPAQTSKGSIKSTVEYPIQTKGVFAIDEDKNVVIQLVNEDGEVVRQMPPEDYLEMVKKLKAIVKSHYDIEA